MKSNTIRIMQTCAVVATEMLERGNSPLSRSSSRKLNDTTGLQETQNYFQNYGYLPKRLPNMSSQVDCQTFESSALILQHL